MSGACKRRLEVLAEAGAHLLVVPAVRALEPIRDHLLRDVRLLGHRLLGQAVHLHVRLHLFHELVALRKWRKWRDDAGGAGGAGGGLGLDLVARFQRDA